MTDDSPPDHFSALGLRTEMLRAVRAAGFEQPTPVQRAVLGEVLAGRDVLARAPTGSGKTLAFGLPLLQQLAALPRTRAARGNRVAVLVLTPTRELVLQNADVLGQLAAELDTPIKLVAAHGGVSINPQMMALRGGAELVIATPGRLLDLARNGAIQFNELRALVLDEADQLLAPSFADEVADVLSRLPPRRQNLLFSATFPAPVKELARVFLRDPLEVDVDAALLPAAEAPAIAEHAYTVDLERKTALLVHLLRERDLGLVLVFVSMKKTGEKLLTKLAHAHIQAAVFHADKSQHERNQRLQAFRRGELQVLIATDLAGRGIDIDNLATVINFELPRSPNDYVHRIGRTGRAGRAGLAISLICAAEEPHFRVIEKRTKRRVPRETVPGFEPHGLK